jgi:protein TonB
MLFVLLALGLHGALSLAVRGAPARVREPENVTVVELSPVAPSEPAPEKVTAPESAEAPHAAAPAAPPAARAGALMTAHETAPDRDALVDFVTDPAGTSYGSGVVARGGTAERGVLGATPGGVGAPSRQTAVPVGAEPLAAVASLSRRAVLLAQNPCAGFYPSEASADSGAVTLTLVVRADGRVSSALVVSESPGGEGFGKAARACVEAQHFEPSLDREGRAVAAATTIKLRFSR